MSLVIETLSCQKQVPLPLAHTVTSLEIPSLKLGVQAGRGESFERKAGSYEWIDAGGADGSIN